MSSDLKNLSDFVGEAASAAARIGLTLSTERRQYFIEGDGRRLLEDSFALLFKEPAVLPQPVAPQYPADGVEFDLTITESFTGLEMARRFGYDPTGWKYTGNEIVAPQTKRFKLVPIGAQPNFQAVEAACLKHGSIPDGQWCDALKRKFQVDGKGPILVAKASWVNPNRNANFPYVNTDGDTNFNWTDNDFNADWRGLVEVQPICIEPRSLFRERVSFLPSWM